MWKEVKAVGSLLVTSRHNKKRRVMGRDGQGCGGTETKGTKVMGRLKLFKKEIEMGRERLGIS